MISEPGSKAGGTILLVEDQSDVRLALRLLLEGQGHRCVSAVSPNEAMLALQDLRVDCVFMDLNYARDTTSGREGIDLIQRIRANENKVPIVVMTAWGSVDIAVAAMRAGASDFIEKPWDNQRVISIVRTQLAFARSVSANVVPTAQNASVQTDADSLPFCAESPAMVSVLDALDRVAPTDANVLLLGENGTGKGLLAERLHRASLRRAHPFVKVNMGGVASVLFESEMFGHVRGAYTDAKQERMGRLEIADRGTIFLDEIGDLPLEQQPKLLRILEDKKFERLGSSKTISADVRIVSATNVDLHAAIAAGRFRRDLLYRINTVEIVVPPLRERRDDILPMARGYLAHYSVKYRRDELKLSPAAENELLRYSWPGNARELSHAMERAAILARDGEVGDLGLGNTSYADKAAALDAMTLDEAERKLIEGAMEKNDRNIVRAAQELGITRQSLHRRLERFGLKH